MAQLRFFLVPTPALQDKRQRRSRGGERPRGAIQYNPHGSSSPHTATLLIILERDMAWWLHTRALVQLRFPCAMGSRHASRVLGNVDA